MARLTKTQRNDIQTALRQGVSISEVSRQFSVSRPTIHAIRDEIGRAPGAQEPSTVVAFRAQPTEVAALERLVRAGKFKSPSAAMRAICRRAGDFYETDPEVLDEIAALKKELQAIGRNVNQVARAVNSDVLRGRGGGKAVALQAELDQMKKSLRQVSGVLHQIGQREGEKRVAILGKLSELAS